MIEFLWASLALFDDGAAMLDTTPVYTPPWRDLHTVDDARARILRLLAETPDGAPLARFLPPVRRGERGPGATALRRRSAWSSTFVASLELTRRGRSHCSRRSVSGRSRCGPHGAFCRLMVGTAIQPIREAQRSCLSVDDRRVARPQRRAVPGMTSRKPRPRTPTRFVINARERLRPPLRKAALSQAGSIWRSGICTTYSGLTPATLQHLGVAFLEQTCWRDFNCRQR